MIAKAEVKFIRISPTKARQVANLIRHKDVNQGLAILENINKRSREYLTKILKSALSNAKTKGFTPEQLYISKIICNVGPSWKRYKAAAFGRAAPILRRTTHIRIELDLKS